MPAQIAAMEVKLDNLHDDQKDMRDSFKSLRTTLITFAFTVAASAVVFAFAALQVTK